MENQTPTYGNDVEAQMPPEPEMPQQAAPLQYGTPPFRFGIPQKGYIGFPSWLRNWGIVTGLVIMVAVIWAFNERMMPSYLYFMYIAEVVTFFAGSYYFSRRWGNVSVKRFSMMVFWVGVLLRTPIMLYHHFDNLATLGEQYYLYLADIEVYVGTPVDFVDTILSKGEWNFKILTKYIAFDDLGAPIFNSILLLLTANINPPLTVLISNVILGAITPLFMYHIAQRHFGENVGRLTALFCMLNPNMIWWCAMMMKETEMVFFACWFMDRMDGVLYKGKISLLEVLPIALIGMFTFLYRAALGVLLFVAFFITLILIGKKFVSTGKKIVAGLMVALVIGLGFGEQMIEQTFKMKSSVESGGQRVNMEWRTNRLHGNAFAKYASAAVFAPLIFTIPFPTLTYTYEGQIALMEVAGGNYIKNLLSILVILILLYLLLTGTWRPHVFLESYLLGYLIILVVSTYAQSGRFHMPVIPFEMMFAAYCINVVLNGTINKPVFLKSRTFKRWFGLWCFICIAFAIFWQWFKLEGQGIL